MKNFAISRRYAKALMLIGKEDGQAEQYSEELNRLAGLIGQQPGLEQAITNPLYDRGARRNILEEMLRKLELSRVMQSFVLLLFDKGRISFLSGISDLYQKLTDELKGIARAQVISAVELSAETIEKIRQALSRKTGKEVVLDVQQDASLIGGIVTKIGDLVLDGSIKTQLINMRESFKKGESV